MFDAGGKGFECDAQVCDLRGEPGQGARLAVPRAVFLDDGAQLLVSMSPLLRSVSRCCSQSARSGTMNSRSAASSCRCSRAW